MSILSQTLNKMAANPVHTFRAVFPAWKNGAESSMQGSNATDAIEHGIIAGTISPIAAAATEKTFSYIPGISKDNIWGNSLKILKTAATPAAASTACFATVTTAKVVLGSTLLAASTAAITPILIGGAAVAGGSILAANIMFKAPEENSPNEQIAKMTDVPTPTTTILQKVNDRVNNSLRTVAENGTNTYRTLFPANLTFLGATLIGGFAAPIAIPLGMIAGLASVKTAQVTQQAYANSAYVKVHIEEDNLRGNFLRAGKAVVPALAASTAAVIAPAAAILGTAALTSATVFAIPVVIAATAAIGIGTYEGQKLYKKMFNKTSHAPHQNKMTLVNQGATAPASPYRTNLKIPIAPYTM